MYYECVLLTRKINSAGSYPGICASKSETLTSEKQISERQEKSGPDFNQDAESQATCRHK